MRRTRLILAVEAPPRHRGIRNKARDRCPDRAASAVASRSEALRPGGPCCDNEIGERIEASVKHAYWAAVEAQKKMACRPGSGLPTAGEAEIPLLKCLESRRWGGVSRARWILEDVEKLFPDLRDSDLRPAGQGKDGKFARRIRQANCNLVSRGEMERPMPGWWAVTGKGRATAPHCMERTQGRDSEVASCEV